jgi:hypothetical protein
MSVLGDLVLIRAVHWLRAVDCDDDVDIRHALEDQLAQRCPWMHEERMVEDLHTKLVQVLTSSADEDFIFIHMDLILDCCVYTHAKPILESTFMSPIVAKHQEISQALDVLYWSLRTSLAATHRMVGAMAGAVEFTDTLEMTIDTFCGLTSLQSPTWPLFERLHKAHMAAALIQRTWRWASSDPVLPMCRRRLLRMM